MTAGRLLACDWGTTNLRAWVLDEAGQVQAEQTFALGVAALAPGEAARRFETDVRPALGATRLPAILCGMIGSNLGWRQAPYAPCPAALNDLAAQLFEVAPGVRIVPGLIGPGLTEAPDVMRGEETQILGWAVEKADRSTGVSLVCHPGTHAKWALLEGGAITRFITVMTGELFAVLGRHSVLRHEGAGDDEDAFDAGVRAAGDGGALAARLFSARSRIVGGHAAGETTRSYLSGLLIGAEIASMRGRLCAADTPLVLLGDLQLCRWYARAARTAGVDATIHDGLAAARRGLHALASLESHA